MTIFIVITIIHALVMLGLRLTWNRIETFGPKVGGLTQISVIIPVRNESENIIQLLENLKQQDYDKHAYEVIIVNDHSQDETVEKVTATIKSEKSFRLIHLTEQQGKKAASTLGVQQAKGAYILCTDGDCSVPKSWISTYAAYIAAHQPHMISGPVKMTGSRFFDKVQSMDFSALLAFGATSLQHGMATICNGANMAYRKASFEEVGGYTGNEHLASGDDEFLLQKIFARYGEKVLFMKSQTAIVETLPKFNLKDFLQQRMRWSSKWRFYDGFWMRATWIFTFFDFMSVFALTGAMLLNYVNWGPGLLLILIRWLSEGWYMKGPSDFLRIKRNTFHMVTVSFIYPFYVLFLGFASIFGSYSWKGRKYR